MTRKEDSCMKIQELTKFLDNKILQNENEIVITFYELWVQMNLLEDTNYFLKLCRTRFKNLGYKVYETVEKFTCVEVNRMLQSNQLII